MEKAETAIAELREARAYYARMSQQLSLQRLGEKSGCTKQLMGKLLDGTLPGDRSIAKKHLMKWWANHRHHFVE